MVSREEVAKVGLSLIGPRGSTFLVTLLHNNERRSPTVGIPVSYNSQTVLKLRHPMCPCTNTELSIAMTAMIRLSLTLLAESDIFVGS